MAVLLLRLFSALRRHSPPSIKSINNNAHSTKTVNIDFADNWDGAMKCSDILANATQSPPTQPYLELPDEAVRKKVAVLRGCHEVALDQSAVVVAQRLDELWHEEHDALGGVPLKNAQHVRHHARVARKSGGQQIQRLQRNKGGKVIRNGDCSRILFRSARFLKHRRFVDSRWT